MVLAELQAVIDESVDQDGGFVMAGYIASAASWVDFSREWEQALRLTTCDKEGRRRFKMKEMARAHMDDVPLFYSTIKKHVLLALYCYFDVGDLQRAMKSIWSPPRLDIDWAEFGNRHFFAFRALMDMFHTNRVTNIDGAKLAKIIPLDKAVDFYFDDHTSKKHDLAAWDDYIASRADGVRELYGATQRFENDTKFLPLQAAEFWGWWVRLGYKENRIEAIKAGDFGPWRGDPIPGMAISFSEDQLADALISFVRPLIEAGRPIYRVRFSLNGRRL